MTSFTESIVEEAALAVLGSSTAGLTTAKG